MVNDTSDNKVGAYGAVIIITLALLALGIAFDYPAATRGAFFSDCATYYALADSLAHDFDIEFNRHDIQRIYADFSGGPSGIFLQRNSETGKLYMGKAFIYPLFLAPAVALFGTNGILLTHALLAGALLWGMVALWQRRWGTRKALLVALAFLLPTAALVYYFWVSPEFFNTVVIFYAFFFIIYKDENPAVDSESSPWWRRLLLSPWSDLLGFAAVGIVTFSKLSNGIFILPALALVAFRGRWKNFILGGLAFGLAAALLFGAQWGATGNWNYQGGDRKSFHSEFPYANGKSFDTANPTAMTTNLADYRPPFYLTDIAHNVFYFFFGRFGGMMPYFFPAFLAMLLFLWRGRGSPQRWVILGGALLAALTYIVLIPTNVIGGGGTVANRYFMNIFPLFFFLLPERLPRWTPAAAVVAGLLFMGNIFISPVFYSLYPARYLQSPVARLLPVEYTMLNDLPINTDGTRRRMPWFLVEDGEPARHKDGPKKGELNEDFFVYHLDYNSYEKEPNPKSVFIDDEGRPFRNLLTEQGTQQIWTRGRQKAEMILRTGEIKNKLHITVTNAPVRNTITVRVQGASSTLEYEPRQRRILTFDLAPPFAYHYESTSYLYEVIVTTSNGISPRTLPDGGNDFRYLGAMLQFEFE